MQIAFFDAKPYDLPSFEKEGSENVWLSFAPIPEEEIKTHFPNIYRKCLEEGYDVTKEPIPVVPSQHYFMGGIDVDKNAIQRIECGKRFVTDIELVVLAKVLEQSVEELLNI